MIITLIGMSGAGKTYWSKKLAEKGFVRYCCDDLIEKLLERELKKSGYRGITDVAKWMGQPYDKQYQKTSKMYLQKEIRVMKHIIKIITSKNNNQNTVIDTTGSGIYTGKNILNLLVKHTRVVYLETPPSEQDRMFKLYIQDPKPVIWNGIFSKNTGESNQEALARCYPILLKTRAEIYRKLAHKTLDYFTLRLDNYNADRFLHDVTAK